MSITFVDALISRCPGLDEVWAVWHAHSSHGTTPVTVAILAALHSLLRIRVPPEEMHCPVANTLSRLASALVSTELGPFYRFCSSGDHTKANHALHLLATAASYSPSYTMQFLTNFNFAFNMLPKLAAPRRTKRPAQESGQNTVIPAATAASASPSADWHDPDLSKRPSRALFIHLTMAVLDSAPPGAGAAMALRAPQLLPLAMHNLSRDPPQTASDFCSLLLSKILSPGRFTPAPSPNCLAHVLHLGSARLAVPQPHAMIYPTAMSTTQIASSATACVYAEVRRHCAIPCHCSNAARIPSADPRPTPHAMQPGELSLMHAGADIGVHACAHLLDGQALWQLALISSGGRPSPADDTATATRGRDEAAAAASAVLLRAASDPRYGLWEPVQHSSSSTLRVAPVRAAGVSLRLMAPPPATPAEAHALAAGALHLCQMVRAGWGYGRTSVCLSWS